MCSEWVRAHKIVPTPSGRPGGTIFFGACACGRTRINVGVCVLSRNLAFTIAVWPHTPQPMINAAQHVSISRCARNVCLRCERVFQYKTMYCACVRLVSIFAKSERRVICQFFRRSSIMHIFCSETVLPSIYRIRNLSACNPQTCVRVRSACT